jgi:hypothetical protein
MLLLLHLVLLLWWSYIALLVKHCQHVHWYHNSVSLSTYSSCLSALRPTLHT